MSRTALDPAKALWFDRRRLLVALLACTGVAALVSLLLSRTLSRPLRAVTAAARATARGEARQPIAAPRIAAAELIEMSRAVDRMGEQLLRRADYIAGFAGNASHELRTPIAAIRGAAELLEQDWRGMTEAERNLFIGNIAADARRMECLVAGMLELARIENATDPDEAIDARPVLRAVAERFGERVRLDLGALPEQLRIRAEHLDSAISNLVDNAIRHGRGPVTLEAVTGPDGRVAIRVRDRGPGISSGNLARIYDRFFTTARDHGGTGLGLCIAQAVAERAGGRLRCQSGPHGTCFEFVV
jgi:signal transduction histidine kinase